MSVLNRTAGRPLGSDHIVQFFDTDDSRSERVAEFLAEGYHRGEPIVVIARPAGWAAVKMRLEALGMDVSQAASEGMLLVKNAEGTLRRISRGGSPDPDLFADTIGQALSTLATRGPRVRAYGEMVDILVQRDDVKEALALEALWNVVSERIPVYLLCGYSAAHFVSAATHAALRDICSAHSGIAQNGHDPLAGWVLTTAHNCAAESSNMRH